ncbi:ParB N-terminal domain-containing protein [Mesorhizobium sp. M0139]|uniref:ParB N-terminal domain-containing protein n=1 Tax=unclassified Mesorhizobium TaxID=325217 RepID=UPI00333CE477
MNTAEITIPLAGRAELAASIEAHGLIHNLLTRKAPKGAKFEVVAGGRRLGALRLLLDEGRTVQGCDQGLSGQAPNDEARESEKDI